MFLAKGDRMKRRMCLLFALTAALCLLLVGCGKNEHPESFAGVWELDGMIQDGEEASNKDIESLKTLGMSVYIVLDNDGSASMNMLGTKLEGGTWKATDASTASLTFATDDEQTSRDLTLDDSGRLSLIDGANRLYFKRTSAEAMEEFLSKSTSLVDLLGVDPESLESSSEDSKSSSESPSDTTQEDAGTDTNSTNG